MKAISKTIDSILNKLKIVPSIVDSFSEGSNLLSVKYLAGSLKQLFTAKLAINSKKPIFIITKDFENVEEWYHDLKFFFDESSIALLAKPPKHVKVSGISDDDHNGWLIDALGKISHLNSSIAIATTEIFEYLLPKQAAINSHKLLVKIGDSRNFEKFTTQLMLNGFDKKEYVFSQGDISIRGGIVDIFPIGWDNPLRIEFWGDEVDSIREFEPLSQRSIREHKEVEFIANFFDSTANLLESDIFEYIKSNSICVIDSPEQLELNFEIAEKLKRFKILNLNPLSKADYQIKSKRQPNFNASIKDFIIEIRKLAFLNYKITLSADGKIHTQRLREIVENAQDIGYSEVSEISSELANNNILHQAIKYSDYGFSSGFICDDIQTAIITEHQLFEHRRVRETKKSIKAASININELKELKIGDYVVHEDKGIGKFDGFQTVTMGGSQQDCIRIIFAGNDLLYVSLNYINKITKYSANENTAPILSKLGTTDWNRKKERTKKKLKDIARDLIKLYAQRKAQPGFAYPIDTMWQKEFEASFPYEDTPDQARTTFEIKKDMESKSPMDRLVCGDVGFGKTEVAIRAAFKAVQAGKQVAVLVPTTILAQQHYMSFKDRLGKYPVNINALSRFRTPMQQTEMLSHLRQGGLDILIGTHRLLSKDVEFKNLGLLIIDEEHRFGVSAKEKLRQLRANIDTLTLTATPIPRTLNFSLLGARDLSLIETPPRNRLPVYTEIMEWNNDTVVNAINREVERGGQVFFVSDKIDDLDKIAMQLQMLLPTLRFVVAHGQMKPKILESIMEKFTAGKYDVLLSTKIIESGIDIPNANTMLINRANNFGLAELYQLRGRVGRSNTQAYCYLLVSPDKKINPKAFQRLQALEEFIDLGSGFKLAMRDLEIRGAGNLLGAEQSGFIIDIGFELYQRILEETVQELKVEEFSELFEDKIESKPLYIKNDDVQIELDTDALFPNDYIKNNTDRFMYYKKLYEVRNNDELEDIVSEIKDRYGKLPKQAKDLIFVVKLRIAALETGIVRILIKPNTLICEFPSEENKDFYEKAFPLIVDYINDIEIANLKQNKSKLLLEVYTENRDKAVEILWKIKKTLEYI